MAVQISPENFGFGALFVKLRDKDYKVADAGGLHLFVRQRAERIFHLARAGGRATPIRRWTSGRR